VKNGASESDAAAAVAKTSVHSQSALLLRYTEYKDALEEIDQIFGQQTTTRSE
jgi:hypothetical protein